MLEQRVDIHGEDLGREATRRQERSKKGFAFGLHGL
jgi:hypothetical protein